MIYTRLCTILCTQNHTYEITAVRNIPQMTSWKWPETRQTTDYICNCDMTSNALEPLVKLTGRYSTLAISSKSSYLADENLPIEFYSRWNLFLYVREFPLEYPTFIYIYSLPLLLKQPSVDARITVIDMYHLLTWTSIFCTCKSLDTFVKFS